MSQFLVDESIACCKLVALALAEDLGPTGDRTSDALIPADQLAKAAFVARTPGVLAGLPAVELVIAAVNGALRLEPHVTDGSQLARGTRIATLSGPLRDILKAERTALNFLQRLSGVATLTRTYVDAVAGLPAAVLDTRKTTPGWRILEKYAVRMGGGTNHRIGLYDGILIKDNHIAGLGDPPTAVRRAVELARAYPGNEGIPVEIEVDTLDQLEQALVARPEIVLLDNMPPEMLCAAVARRNAVAPEVRLEASGGVNLTTVRGIAETGVDCISVGALTHSAPALDIALDFDTLRVS
ncbi:carboxylating nicotinate-nucleotide diphosphorylase [Fimbriiglobus ruber]|uniref:Probable nicotinate-nucleotide pyrophosphorylase [carboxylating] n=1 Tax=Fimbriiglobus ruber TaxID=1908690 RepID=A0A225DPQ0_9BACT|nr:carboxylating nicotinate-nucleotide diphosphorylase [Fimbriiglobus ruber]OWK43281.1 Quinolinate phosphoribosyltransferase [decarboxylating] [Fimbriiglobus ruber]